MTADVNDFKAVMRRWVSGVTVVTAAEGEERSGTTVSAFTSVSVDPPLIVICLFRESSTFPLIERTGKFAVSILSDEQDDLSAQFAGYTELPEGANKFYNVAVQTGELGMPVLAESNGWFECSVHDIYDGSTHGIVVGHVEHAVVREDELAPLVYYNRAYRDLVEKVSP